VAEVGDCVPGQQLIGDSQHHPVGRADGGGAQADFLHVAPAAVEAADFLGQQDTIPFTERPVDDDEDAGDNVLHRVLRREGDRQANNAERRDDSRYIDTQFVGRSQDNQYP